MTTETADATTEAPTGWVQDATGLELWRKDQYAYNSGYVCAYGNHTRGYNWQAIRGEHRISGSEDTPEAAMAAAEAGMALSDEAFSAIVAADLKEKLCNLEQELIALCPDEKLLPGYRAGFEAGYAACRQRIEEALQ